MDDKDNFEMPNKKEENELKLDPIIKIESKNTHLKRASTISKEVTLDSITSKKLKSFYRKVPINYCN